MALKVEDVQTYCKGMLGHPKVEVELDDIHYQLAMDKTLRTIALNRPREKYLSFSVSAGTQSYDLSAEDYGYDIIDVQYPPADYVMEAEFDVFNPRIMERRLDLGEFELGLIYAEMARKTLSADFEWDFNAETGLMLISPTPGRSYTAVARCLDEVRGTDIRSPWLKQWALAFSLACCKQMLGEIRRKISSVEGTEVTFELDGGDLMQEGREDEQRMIEDLKVNSGDFVAPMTGD